MENFSVPPIEVLVGFVLVFIIGTILGAAICLPICIKNQIYRSKNSAATGFGGTHPIGFCQFSAA